MFWTLKAAKPQLSIATSADSIALAFAKDSEYGNQDGKSQSHYKMFSQSIGVKYTVDTSIGGQSQSDGNQGGNPAANLINTR